MVAVNLYERTAAGWAITARPEPGRPTWKIIAISADRQRVIHREKSTVEELATFSPEKHWKGPR